MVLSSWMQICTAGAPSMASYAQVRADSLSLVAPMIATFLSLISAAALAQNASVPRRVAYFAFAVRLLKSTSVAAAR